MTWVGRRKQEKEGRKGRNGVMKGVEVGMGKAFCK